MRVGHRQSISVPRGARIRCVKNVKNPLRADNDLFTSRACGRRILPVTSSSGVAAWRLRSSRRANNVTGIDSTPTEELSAGGSSAGGVTAEHLAGIPPTSASVPPTEPSLSPLPVARERCAMCGATLAADQRYCVECGQRCGPSRVPFTEGLAQRATAPSPEPRPGRRRPSVNATLIAGIGTLLLALGVGVLIGRLGESSTVKSPAVQVVTVAGGGAGATAGAAGTGSEAQTSTTAAGTAKTGAATTGAAGAAAKAKAAKPAVPVTKVVKIGSKGNGPGYQHGHFTGNFFGG